MKNVNQYEKTSKRVFNENQCFCKNCDNPINKNCHSSTKMNGLCSKCFNLTYNENQKRHINKTKSKARQNQRKYKMMY